MQCPPSIHTPKLDSDICFLPTNIHDLIFATISCNSEMLCSNLCTPLKKASEHLLFFSPPSNIHGLIFDTLVPFLPNSEMLCSPSIHTPLNQIQGISFLPTNIHGLIFAIPSLPNSEMQWWGLAHLRNTEYLSQQIFMAFIFICEKLYWMSANPIQSVEVLVLA